MKDPNKRLLSDDELAKAAKSILNDGLSNVDDEVRSRLQQARREAVGVALHSRENRNAAPRWLVPASGIAVLMLAVGLSLFSQIQPTDDQSPIDQTSIASTEDIPLLT